MPLPELTLLLESTSSGHSNTILPPSSLLSSPTRSLAPQHTGSITSIPLITLPLRVHRSTAVHPSTLSTYPRFLGLVTRLYHTDSAPTVVYVYHPAVKGIVEVESTDVERVWERGHEGGWRFVFIVGAGFVAAAQMFATRNCLGGGKAEEKEKDKEEREWEEEKRLMRERRYMVVLSNEWDPVVGSSGGNVVSSDKGRKVIIAAEMDSPSTPSTPASRGNKIPGTSPNTLRSPMVNKETPRNSTTLAATKPENTLPTGATDLAHNNPPTYTTATATSPISVPPRAASQRASTNPMDAVLRMERLQQHYQQQTLRQDRELREKLAQLKGPFPSTPAPVPPPHKSILPSTSAAAASYRPAYAHSNNNNGQTMARAGCTAPDTFSFAQRMARLGSAGSINSLSSHSSNNIPAVQQISLPGKTSVLGLDSGACNATAKPQIAITPPEAAKSSKPMPQRYKRHPSRDIMDCNGGGSVGSAQGQSPSLSSPTDVKLKGKKVSFVEPRKGSQ